MKSKDHANPTAAHLGRAEILSIAGNIDDAKVAAIEESGATAEQLEEAVAWASGLSGVMSKERRPLAGLVAPISVLGCVIQHTAETLSGIVISQATAPGAPIIYGGSPGVLEVLYTVVKNIFLK